MLKEAIQWVKRNAKDRRYVPVSNRIPKPYPEVTGYWIPTLLQTGEPDMAAQFAHFLISTQNADGSFSLDNPEQKYVFDTGQILRGWVSVASRIPEVLDPMRKACEWIIKTADPQTGRFLAPKPGGDWSLGKRGEVNEGIHLYVVQPMRDAAALLGLPAIHAAADRALNYYLKELDLTHFERPNVLTHFYSYIQEALVETGCHDHARIGMESVARFQQSNGIVPAYHDVPWVCTPGLAQLAKTWFMLGQNDRAEAALKCLNDLQNYTGGFYGSYGVGADYFPTDEIAWAPKYAIDAELLAIKSHFASTSGLYSTKISVEDGRAQAILAACQGAHKILDAGCGKGRYAALVKAHYPNADVYGTDVSAEMLAAVPPDIQTQLASLQDMPFTDGTFDVVFCIEALEHAPNPSTAMAEMARLVRPGGQLVIIDKNVEKLGALQIERWETWFSKEWLMQATHDNGMDCTITDVAYNDRGADGLFLLCVGKKSNQEAASRLVGVG